MTIRRALALLLATALVLIGGLAAPAQAGAVPITAQATQAAPGAAQEVADNPADCPDFYLCIFKDSRYTGTKWQVLARARGTCDNVGYNDTASSIWNGSGTSVRFYNDAGCTGTAFSLANGSGSSLMTITHPTSADKVTSIKWGY